jgi:hypothetical protein
MNGARERPLLYRTTGGNGSIAPVQHLQELTLALLPMSVGAAVSANGCSGE